ncbi:unnamed protein product [Rotaria sp. Silwood1]|nr:unnamed protein product [Rotaria sp. Silwood1]
MVTKRTCGLPLICLVCGDVARGINYGLMTCMPSCRLKKCFILGMNPKLIRHWSYNQFKSKHEQLMMNTNQNNNQLPMPLTLSLLNNDRSNLTIDEWNLLSNIIHSYDEANIIPQMKYHLEQQSSLPPKLRLKPSKSILIFKVFFSTLQLFIERSPYFHDLSIHTRQILIQNNFETAGALNSIFLIRELKALDNMVFITNCTTIYGDKIIKHSDHLTARLEPNGILVKIMILILAFSTNCSIVIPHYSDNIMSLPSALSIFKIQSIFVTMFWKYLTYQYGFNGAVRCFNCLIKYILDILHSANENRNIQHEQMMKKLVEETKNLLKNEN